MAATDLPNDMREWIEDATSSTVLEAVRQPGGGRKQAWFVDLAEGEATRRLFLRWDPSDPGVRWDPWTVRREAQVYRALTGSGLPVAQFISQHPTREAMLLSCVSGQAAFGRIRDEAEKIAVAQDFIRHLAVLHSLDVAELNLDDTGAVPRPVAAYVDDRLDELEAVIARRGGVAEPLLRAALIWLRDNVPQYSGRPALIQGDTGPGNFLFEEGRVSAIVDWELAHLGDPMEDIAWVSLRATQDPFTDLVARFNEYATLSGNAIDADRVRYYRVLAEATILAMDHRVREDPTGDVPSEGGGPDVGASLIFGQLHRRLCVESLAEALDVELPEWSPVVQPFDHTGDAGLFDEALAQLRHVVVPTITDPFAGQRAKSLARILKYLKGRSLFGAIFDRAEIEDIANLLGEPASTVKAARDDLSRALARGDVDPRAAIPILHSAVMYANDLLRAASGALADRHYLRLDHWADATATVITSPNR